MNDLMKCLYDFVCSRRSGSLYQDPEYEEVSRGVELQMKKVQQTMSEEQREELSLLLASVFAQNVIESEHLFQASLRLAGELGRAASVL